MKGQLESIKQISRSGNESYNICSQKHLILFSNIRFEMESKKFNSHSEMRNILGKSPSGDNKRL